MLNDGCWVLDAGYWMLDTGCWILDAGYWMLDTGCWILDAGYWMLDAEQLLSPDNYRDHFYLITANIDPRKNRSACQDKNFIRILYCLHIALIFHSAKDGGHFCLYNPIGGNN